MSSASNVSEQARRAPEAVVHSIEAIVGLYSSMFVGDLRRQQEREDDLRRLRFEHMAAATPNTAGILESCSTPASIDVLNQLHSHARTETDLQLRDVSPQYSMSSDDIWEPLVRLLLAPAQAPSCLSREPPFSLEPAAQSASAGAEVLPMGPFATALSTGSQPNLSAGYPDTAADILAVGPVATTAGGVAAIEPAVTLTPTSKQIKKRQAVPRRQMSPERRLREQEADRREYRRRRDVAKGLYKIIQSAIRNIEKGETEAALGELRNAHRLMGKPPR